MSKRKERGASAQLWDLNRMAAERCWGAIALQEGKVSVHAVVARPGIVLLDTSLNMIASNAEAVQILTFPDVPERIPPAHAWFNDGIRSRLFDRRSPGEADFVNRFKSAKRTYVCRSFPLSVPLKAAGSSPTLLLLLERNLSNGVTMADISERFRLTPREQETVKLLLQGLTSKEIAQRMKISPNTVKAFIRLVMVKMDVSTRSGIIGKIAEVE